MRLRFLAVALLLAACQAQPVVLPSLTPQRRETVGAQTAGRPATSVRPEDFASDWTTAWNAATFALTNNVVYGERPDGPDYQLLAAGSHQFYHVWAWDFAFAAEGAMIAGLTPVVKDTLEAYFERQRPNGLLPRVLDTMNFKTRVFWGAIGRQLPFEGPLRASFDTENGVISHYPNIVLPWTAWSYIKRSHDVAFAARWFEAARRAEDRVELDLADAGDGLIAKQPPFADWADSVGRTGRVAFTQELSIVSLRALAEWARFLATQSGPDVPPAAYLQAQALRYEQLASRRLQAFRAKFWDPGRGFVGNYNADTRMSADSNLFGIAHGLFSQEEGRHILKTLQTSPLWQGGLPGRATYPDYPLTIKSLTPAFAGLSHYHDRFLWLWLSAAGAMAQVRVGDTAGARETLKQATRLVAAHDGVHEVYEFRGDRWIPVSRPFYKAEEPFTWSSGMLLEAMAQVATTR